ncbi:hypothetical protein B0H63DRAFT_89153 [Podospora didyma]|uniref:CorA-like transporter domain-containing protein n=1 Tax=Podospora didyma TaxID=330526 RepID=A0AAE0N286_9PEZI|nr:hypothetical protein B0H63DRAFT_89153 [Podospora didyma]
MTPNGRTTGSAWSLRQTAVYQQVDLHKQTNTWILIQPEPETFKQFLAAAARRGGVAEGLACPKCMEPNLLLLSAGRTKWKEYTAHLRHLLRPLEEKASFSRVGRPSKSDFEVGFSDGQELHRIRKKLVRTWTVLESTIRIIDKWESLFHNLDYRFGESETAATLSGVHEQCQNLRSTLQYHLGAVTKLSNYSAHTEKLLLGILDFRQNEVYFKCQQLVQNELASMHAIAALAEQENRTVARLAEEAREDAKMMRAVSVLAALYLPATLVASIFSSSLVQAQPIDAITSIRLTVTSDIWVFFLLAGLLVLVTLFYVLWLKQRIRKQKHTKVC